MNYGDSARIKVDGYMPLWVGDYLADTMKLTYCEHGAYLLLIMAHWMSGPLLDDDASLQKIIGCEPEEWQDCLGFRYNTGEGGRSTRWVPIGRVTGGFSPVTGYPISGISPESSQNLPKTRPKVAQNRLGLWRKILPFFRSEDGFLYHDRVMKEKAKAIELKRKVVERGKKAAATRWAKDGMQKHDRGQVLRMLDYCTPPPPIEEIGVTDVTPSLLLTPPRVEAPRVSTRPEIDLFGRPLADSDSEGKAPASKRLPACPVREVVELWHRTLPALPRMERLTAAREASIRQRWREWAVEKGWSTPAEGLAEWEVFFRWIGESEFLTGRAKPKEAGKIPFVATLEWVMLPRNHVRIFEGAYHG